MPRPPKANPSSRSGEKKKDNKPNSKPTKTTKPAKSQEKRSSAGLELNFESEAKKKAAKVYSDAETIPVENVQKSFARPKSEKLEIVTEHLDYLKIEAAINEVKKLVKPNEPNLSKKLVSLAIDLNGWQLLKLGNPIKISLKHPFRGDFKSCVIVKTVFEETQRDKILGFNIPTIKDVIGIDKLKALAANKNDLKHWKEKFDMFFCDKNVAPLLHFLPAKGSCAFRGNSFPVRISNVLDPEILSRAVNSTYFHRPSGSLCTVPVGNLKQSMKQIIENSLDTIGRLLEKVEFENINSIAFQSKDSARFNFYMTESVAAKMEEKLKGEQLPNARKEKKKERKKLENRATSKKASPHQNRNSWPNSNRSPGSKTNSPHRSPQPPRETYNNKSPKSPRDAPNKSPKSGKQSNTNSPLAASSEPNKTFKFEKKSSSPQAKNTTAKKKTATNEAKGPANPKRQKK